MEPEPSSTPGSSATVACVRADPVDRLLQEYPDLAQLNPSESLLQTLSQRCTSDSCLQTALLDLVKSSRFDQDRKPAAANAITVLNRANFNFSRHDLRNVDISGANLTNSMCGGTDFRGADLSAVNFSNSWLVNANFKGTNLFLTEFGEELRVTCLPGEAPTGLTAWIDTPGNPILTSLCIESVKKNNHPHYYPEKTSWVHCWNFNTGNHLRPFQFQVKRTKAGDFRHSALYPTKFRIIPCTGKLFVAVWFCNHPDIEDTSCFVRLYDMKAVKGRPLPVEFNLKQMFGAEGKNEEEHEECVDVNCQWICMYLNGKIKAFYWRSGQMRLERDEPIPKSEVRRHVTVVLSNCVYESDGTNSTCFLGLFRKSVIRIYKLMSHSAKDEGQAELIGVLVLNQFTSALVFDDRPAPLKERLVTFIVGREVHLHNLTLDQENRKVRCATAEASTLAPKAPAILSHDTFMRVGVSVKCVAFNPPATLLASSDNFGNILVWSTGVREAEDGTSVPFGKLLQKLSRRLAGVSSLCFHPTKPIIAASSNRSPTIQFYKLSLPSPKSLHECHEQEDNGPDPFGKILRVAISHGQEWVATLHPDHPSSEKGSIGYATESKHLLKFWKTSGHQSNATSYTKPRRLLGEHFAMDFSPDDQHFIFAGVEVDCGSEERTGIGTDDETRNGCGNGFDACVEKGHVQFVVLLLNIPRGDLHKRVVLSEEIWGFGSKKLVEGVAHYIYSCDLNMKAKRFQMATESWNGTVQLWTYDNWQQKFKPSQLLSYDCPGESYYSARINAYGQLKVACAATTKPWEHVDLWINISSDQEWVITKNMINTVRIWRVGAPSNQPAYVFDLLSAAELKEKQYSKSIALYFDPDLLQPLLYSMSGSLQVWKVNPVQSRWKSKMWFKIEGNSFLYSAMCVINKPGSKSHQRCLLLSDREGSLQLRDAGSFKLLRQIPLWFAVHTLHAYQPRRRSGLQGTESGNVVDVIVAGSSSNLIVLQFTTDGEWTLKSILNRQQTELIAKNLNYDKCIRLSDWSRGILDSFGAFGTPAPPGQAYYLQSSLFRLLPADEKESKPRHFLSILRNRNQHQSPEFFASNSRWVVSLVGRRLRHQKSKFRILLALLLRRVLFRHTFLVLEGVVHDQRFLIRADLKLWTGDTRILILKPYASLQQAEEDLKDVEGIQFEIGPATGRQLVENVRNEQQEDWEYSFFIHNCISWCLLHLSCVGVPINYWKMLRSLPNSSIADPADENQDGNKLEGRALNQRYELVWASSVTVLVGIFIVIFIKTFA